MADLNSKGKQRLTGVQEEGISCRGNSMCRGPVQVGSRLHLRLKGGRVEQSGERSEAVEEPWG